MCTFSVMTIAAVVWYNRNQIICQRNCNQINMAITLSWLMVLIKGDSSENTLSNAPISVSKKLGFVH